MRWQYKTVDTASADDADLGRTASLRGAFLLVETPKSPHADAVERKQSLVVKPFSDPLPPTVADSTRRKSVSIVELFTYADTRDKLLMAVGAVGAVVAGVT